MTGRGIYSRTLEHRASISRAMLGKNVGKRHTEESKHYLAAITRKSNELRLLRKKLSDIRNILDSTEGYKHSEEAKQKMREVR